MKFYKHPLEYVPLCIRLFFFYSAMAWVSLFNPSEGQKMVDFADEAAVAKARKDILKAWNGNRHDRT